MLSDSCSTFTGGGGHAVMIYATGFLAGHSQGGPRLLAVHCAMAAWHDRKGSKYQQSTHSQFDSTFLFRAATYKSSNCCAAYRRRLSTQSLDTMTDPSSIRKFSEDPDAPDIHPWTVLGSHIVMRFMQGQFAAEHEVKNRLGHVSNDNTLLSSHSCRSLTCSHRAFNIQVYLGNQGQ